MPDTQVKILPVYSPTGTRTIKASQVGLQGTDQEDEGKYRRLTSKSERDLTPLAYLDVCKKAFYLWQRNLLAKRIVEILVDFCVGEELKVVVKCKKRTKQGEEELTDRNEGQQCWDDFYEDPMNDLQDDLGSMFTDYLINGEQIIPANVNKTDGKVWLGYLDPRYILPISYDTSGNIQSSGVVPVPGNIRKVDEIIMQPPGSTEVIRFKVIRHNMDGNPNSNPRFGKLDGQVFFFQLNKLPTQLRGYSILMTDIDWADAFDQFLFGALDGFDARNDYFFDCELEGFTQDEIDAQKVTRPDRGMVNVHNEKAKWSVIKADLAANDVATAAKLIKDFIVGTNGFSKVWFGEGDTTNRSTAESMAVPTKKMLQRVQAYLKRELKFMCTYVLQCAQEAGKVKLAADEYFDIEVSLYNLDQKELDQAGSGFVQLMNAIKIAVTSGWATDDTAKKLVDGFLASLGFEVDQSQTAEDIKELNQTKQQNNLANDTLNQAPPLNQFMNQQEKLRQAREKAGIGEYAGKGGQQEDGNA
jgi:hypothetical protein